MRVLAFDTATRATAVALCDVGDEVDGLELEARDDPEPGARPGHARRLLPLVEQLLTQGGGWDAVQRIAVGVGPGTFTGLRIGVATAHALARAREIELVGVSTLESLASGAGADYPDSPVLAVIDARRGEAFGAAWTAAGEAALAQSVMAPDELGRAASLLTPGAVAVGDGAIHFRAVLEAAGLAVPADGSALHRVSARQHCRLAAAGRAGTPDAVLPAYLRLADAELQRPA